jgi:hypothetical protein
MRTQLLCTFTTDTSMQATIDQVVESYDILYNKIFILQNVDNVHEFMCTYNIERNHDYSILQNTISLHRKKYTNTLYTINALNCVIQSHNNGVLDTNFQVDWEEYRNCILLTNDVELRRIDTKVDDVVYLKVQNN